jgi:type III restriction enzyme
MVNHLKSYLKDEEEVTNVILHHQQQLADSIHSQMIDHYWEKASDYEVKISKGFAELKRQAFSVPAAEGILDFRRRPVDVTKIAQLVFGGFKKCLYPVQKFQSDTERVLSIILDRESVKWFKPGRSQFQIYYKWGHDQHEYQPDFVAETNEIIYMLEPKARGDMEDPQVQAKKEAAVLWCERATAHNKAHGGKPWKYLLIPHDIIAEQMTIEGLAGQFTQKV